MEDRNSKNVLKKCRFIQLVLTDVDGVLTDGGMFYSEKGEVIKKFNTRDGMGTELLLKNGIKTVFISRESSEIIKKRAKKVRAAGVYLGTKKKELQLEKISKKFSTMISKIAYIGDDVNDVAIMKLVGFSASPSDGREEVKKIVDYVCTKKGGEGAFRELADLIIEARKKSI